MSTLPTISVIIPAHNSAAQLRECLAALAASTVEPFEIIVADDGSTDECEEVARRHGARVVPTGKRSGPACARNKGAKEAKGEILFFLDSDVCVHTDTVERMADRFARDPALDALIGSYDDSPSCQDFLSQYKNLMHAFVHHKASQRACTFWSGCGAIRKRVFEQFNGFDESYKRPAIEDIELGYRLHGDGRKMELDPDVQVKHLKRWSFWGLVKTDILYRGIPWTELILRDRHMPNDLNVQLSQRVSVALAFLLCGMSLFGAIWWRGLFLTPLFAILFLVLGRYWVEFADWKERKAGLLWTAAIVGVIIVTAHFHNMHVLIPPLGLGYVLLLVRHRYQYRSHGWVYLSILLAATFTALCIFSFIYVPWHYFVFSVILVFLAVVLLNTQFYLFLAEKRGGFFALAAIPFHLLYHFYNGVSFLAGTGRYLWKHKRLFGERKAVPGVTAPTGPTTGQTL
ncbi:MAG: glycosyltransferase family 2 protein [Bryobacteraceae bacterium]|nr:glycosyltransferase family 2 protein [Bryobacteraceae bacterium]